MRSSTNIKHNEQGFASIVIALVLIIVLALLTVGFAQLARREQQNALDKQLATQANYAAETGYNDAYNDIKSGAIYDNTLSGGTTDASATHCMTSSPTQPGGNDPLPAAALTATPTINNNSGVKYTCLLVTINTPNLEISGMEQGTGKHATFGTNDNLSTITIKWGSADGHNGAYPSSYSTVKFPSLANWKSGANGYPPVIGFSLTPTNSLDEDTLVSKTSNAYLYPSSASSGNIDAGSLASQAQVIDGNCSGTGAYPCHVTLTGLGNQAYVMHVLDYYDTSNILITATTPSGAATFTGEPIIDVTGKAQDVLKRLQYRVFTNGGNEGANDNAVLPNGALEAQNLCKRIKAAPPTADFPAGSTYDPPAGGLGCNLSD
jgi:Tfp pilus assembly protein PilX